MIPGRGWWWAALAALVIAVGGGLRLAELDRKVFWLDEVSTLRVLAGYRRAEVTAELVRRGEVAATELARYRQVNAERDVGDAVRVLWHESPEAAPLYFVIARAWTRVVGDSPQRLRLLSALLGLLALPAMFWLARAWFGSARAGWLATLLLAVSPIQMLYAQEARMYSLWTVWILVSSAVLARAWRTNAPGAWWWYAATVAAGWYTHVFFGFAVAGHLCFGVEGDRQRRRRLWVAVLGGTALFAPWLGRLLFQGVHVSASAGLNEPPPWWFAALRAVAQFSLPFWDANFEPTGLVTWEAGWRLVVLSVAATAVWALRQEPRPVRLLVWCWIAVGPLFLGAVDLWRGSQLLLVHRYLFVSFLGTQLAVAGWLARRWAWSATWLVTVALLVSGLISCGLVARAPTWWTKGHNATDPLIGRVINAADRPLLVVNARTGGINHLLTLQPWLEPHVRVRVLDSASWPAWKATEAGRDVFVYRPRRADVAGLRAAGFAPVPQVPAGRLWYRRDVAGEPPR